jgi:hypothetical protein
VTSSASSPPKSAELVAGDQQGSDQGVAKAASFMLAALLVVAREKIAAELSVAGGIPMRMGDSDTGVMCDTPNAYRSSSETGLTTREFQNCYSEHLVSRDLVSH